MDKGLKYALDRIQEHITQPTKPRNTHHATSHTTQATTTSQELNQLCRCKDALAELHRGQDLLQLSNDEQLTLEVLQYDLDERLRDICNNNLIITNH